MSINKIIVNNTKRVSDVIGIDLKEKEDLLLNEDPKVKEFISSYENYLNTTSEADMEEFFRLTNLFIAHEYIDRNSYKEITFTLNGPFSKVFELEHNRRVFNNHLKVITYVENLEIKDGCVYADGNAIYTLNERTRVDVEAHRFNMSALNTLELRVKYLSNQGYNIKWSDDLKEVFLDSFNKLLILNNKGELYVDTTLYANGVEEIFELNGSDIMIIYQDGTLEGYNSRDDNLKVEKVDKVLYGENYIAKLANHELTVYLIKEVDQGESYCLKFNNVDDIEYNKDMACLTIKSADGSIDFPVYSLAKLS